jgi:hypothetical protein
MANDPGDVGERSRAPGDGHLFSLIGGRRVKSSAGQTQ